jgi:1,4-dihydroxy-2-naphthoate polyprenyltransferase
VLSLKNETQTTVPFRAYLKWFVQAARPGTLLLAGIPVLKFKTGPWWVWSLILMSATLIQVSTNLWNDALDAASGADGPSRLGSKRVCASGLVSVFLMKQWALGTMLLAALFGLPLVIRGGGPILLLGSLSLVLAYAYTGGPFPLSRLGVSEWFVFLFFGPLSVMGTRWLGSFDTQFMMESVFCGCWAMVPLLINQIRDYEEDKMSQKTTSTVRLGVRFSKAHILLSCLLPTLWLIHLSALKGLCFLCLVLWFLSRVLFEKPHQGFNQYLKFSVLLYLAWSVLL